MKKKVNIFGKKISVFVIALFAVAIVSAALLSYFGVITGNVIVSQGLLVDGKSMPDSETISYSATTTSLEDPVIVSVHYLENQANVDAEVGLDYTCDTLDALNDCDGITTKYYETNLRKGTLELSRKDGSWIPIGSSITVTYYTDVETGKFVVDSIVDLPTDYTLVYYVDEEFTDDGTRLLTPAKAYKIDGSFAIPYADDGNIKGAVNYCSNPIPDNYDHCKGAKLWIIPELELNPDNTLKWSSGWQSNYYFETDLLGWDEYDTDADGSDELSGSFIVPAETQLDFVIVSEFEKMMTPDTYILTTRVVA